MTANTLDDLVKTYVITAAQKGAKPYQPFLESLQTYCSHNKAKLVICPINGAHKDEELHPSLQESDAIVASSLPLNKSISLRDFEIPSQMMNPLTGLNRLVKYNQSAVIASPKQQLKVLANSNSDFPKILTSTGAVTQPNYRTNNRQGLIADMDHVYGAVIVDVIDNKMFNIRHIRSKDGSFHDLNKHYSNTVKKNVSIQALILGDLHSGSVDKNALEAAYEQILALQPKKLILHDIFDAYSVSHHQDSKPLFKAKNYDRKDLLLELDECRSHLLSFASRMGKREVIVVKSNHDEHLTRYLEEGRFIKDERNLKTSVKLADAYFNGKDPLVHGLGLIGKLPSNITFLSRDDDYKVKGVQLASHGDLGSNGSKGTMYQLESSTGPSVTAHAHSPEILREVYRVGTLTNLKLDYNKGPSSWLHTNGVVHNDGTVQLITSINGRWR